MMKVFCDLDQELYMYNVPTKVRNMLAKNNKNIVFIYKNIEEAISEEMKDENVEIYWGNRIQLDVTNMFPNIKWVHFGSVGIDKIRHFSSSWKKEILITNSDGTFENGIVDHTLYQILWLFRGGVSIEGMRNSNIMNRYEHDKSISRIKEIATSRFLVLGYGNIAKKIIKSIKILGGEVDIIKKDMVEIRGSKVYKIKDLGNIAKEYDCIISLLPGSSELVEVLNKKSLFNKMKADSYFINNGRGEHVNEKDLEEILKTKKILGAAIDVTNVEPLPENSKLKKINNLLITPHIATIDTGYWENQYKIFNTNLKLYKANSYDKMENLKNV